MDISSTLQVIRSWPVEEQLQLISAVWDSLIAEGHQPEMTDELRTELDRRLTAHEADPTRVLTWEQVEEHVKSHGR